MSYYHTEHEQKIPPWLLLALAMTLGLLAGPAILVSAALRVALKRLGVPRLVWFLLALLGIGGAWIMVTSTNYLQAFQLMMNAFLPLSCWTRSLLVTPLCTALWELFLSGSVEEQLLDQDRREQAVQVRATMRAKRAARRVPAQVSGQAVIGVVVKLPHNAHA